MPSQKSSSISSQDRTHVASILRQTAPVAPPPSLLRAARMIQIAPVYPGPRSWHDNSASIRIAKNQMSSPSSNPSQYSWGVLASPLYVGTSDASFSFKRRINSQSSQACRPPLLFSSEFTHACPLLQSSISVQYYIRIASSKASITWN